MSLHLPQLDYRVSQCVRELWDAMFRAAGFDVAYYRHCPDNEASFWPPLLSRDNMSYGGVLSWSGSIVGAVCFPDGSRRDDTTVCRVLTGNEMGLYIHHALLACGAHNPNIGNKNVLPGHEWLEYIGYPISLYQFAGADHGQAWENLSFEQNGLRYVDDPERPDGVYPFGKVVIGMPRFLQIQNSVKVCGGPVLAGEHDGWSRFVMFYGYLPKKHVLTTCQTLDVVMTRLRGVRIDVMRVAGLLK